MTSPAEQKEQVKELYSAVMIALKDTANLSQRIAQLNMNDLVALANDLADRKSTRLNSSH